jgi:hypothetical protein
MAPSSVTSRGGLDDRETLISDESYSSGISWAAVIAGAFVAASLWLILLSLGTGLGASSVSPWSDLSASASTVGRAAILWLIITEIIASAMGGYLAGRLRTKWATIHTDEVYFRDTAHGFLVWAVGLVITASFLASAATSMVGSAGTLRSSSLSASAAADPNEYFIDKLLRSNHPASSGIDAPARVEATRIFAHALGQGSLPAADQTYLADLVAGRSGLNHTDAEQRVASVFEQIQQATDTARKAVAHLSLWLFIALLIGAFCASYAATIGGRERDHVKLI